MVGLGGAATCWGLGGTAGGTTPTGELGMGFAMGLGGGAGAVSPKDMGGTMGAPG